MFKYLIPSFYAMNPQNDLKLYLSAIKIQAIYRGYIIRKIYGKILENNKMKMKYNLIPNRIESNENIHHKIDLFINNRKSLLETINNF
tara:strand:+ start:330 stop:593 length:264 start_codon:yes stop_codon:yes gene_type:complete